MRQIIMVIVIIVASVCSAIAAEAVRVPGTRVSIVVPNGFKEAKRFPGFMQEETGASILVTEMPGPFSKVIAGLTKQGFQSRGITLLSRENVTVGTDPGILLHVSQSANGTRFLKWVLVFGNKDGTTMTTATFPDQFEKRLSAALRSSVTSVHLSTRKPLRREEGLTFAVQPAAGLKIAKRIGNNLLLTKDGKVPMASPTDPLLVVGASISQGMKIENKKKFSTARVHALATLHDIRVLSTKPIAVDGLPGFEILATGADKKMKHSMFVCQVTLFADTDYYLMQGLARKSDEHTYLQIFRKTMKTFKRKNVQHDPADKR